MEGLLKAMSNRIHAKLTNNGASAFQMRKRIERLTGIEGDDVQIDEMRKLMMTVCGITLEEEDLLALFGMYDKNCRGSISTAELMEVLVDKDYFNFFMGQQSEAQERAHRCDGLRQACLLVHAGHCEYRRKSVTPRRISGLQISASQRVR